MSINNELLVDVIAEASLLEPFFFFFIKLHRLLLKEIIKELLEINVMFNFIIFI